MNDLNLENKDVDVTINVPGALMEEGFSFTFQPNYGLSVAEYNDIKRPARIVDWFASGVFLYGVGLLVNSASRFIAKAFQPNDKLEAYEWVGGVIALFLALIIWCIGKYIDNPKKTVMKSIDTHFKENPPVKKTVGRGC